MNRPSTIVISDWLANFRQNQWTPFEAATALKAALAKEGYQIVSPNFCACGDAKRPDQSQCTPCASRQRDMNRVHARPD